MRFSRLISEGRIRKCFVCTIDVIKTHLHHFYPFGAVSKKIMPNSKKIYPHLKTMKSKSKRHLSLTIQKLNINIFPFFKAIFYVLIWCIALEEVKGASNLNCRIKSIARKRLYCKNILVYRKKCSVYVIDNID